MGVRSLTSGDKYDAYARRFDGLMLALAGAFLIIWSITSIDIGVPDRVGVVLFWVNLVIWAVFAVDLVIRIAMARSSWRFVLKHPLDVLAVLIPMLRPLKILTVFTSGTRMVTKAGLVRTGQAVVSSAFLLVWVGAVAVYDAEKHAADAVIQNFGDALWWAIVTVTTVGYGDTTPVTVEGRIIATGLMVVGIALLGVVTASVAAWFVRLTGVQDQAEEEAEERRQDEETARLSAKVTDLEVKIDRLLERDRGTQR